MYRLTKHAATKAKHPSPLSMAVLAAADDPTVTYESRQGSGQHRHVRGNLVAIVARDSQQVITFYKNVVDTPLREDQKKAGVRRGQKARANRRATKA